MGMYVQSNGTATPIPGGIPSDILERIENDIAELRALRAGFEHYGMAMITDSSTVTEKDTGLALWAGENNAGIEGTLANRIEKNREQIQGVSSGVSKLKRSISTSTSSPKSGGWYRIARYTALSTAIARGSQANGCGITIKRSYSNMNNEYHHVELASVYDKSAFHKIASLANSRVITNIRHTVDQANKVAYIEIFYNISNENSIFVSLENSEDAQCFWEAIPAEMTQESVPGIVVRSQMELGSS